MTRPPAPDLLLARRRLRLIGLAFVACLAAVGLRVVDLALSVEAVISMPAMASAMTRRARAEIVDRNGILLAVDYPKTSVFADPEEVLDPAAAAARLAPVLHGVEAAVLERKLARPGRFVWLKRHITDAEQRAIIRLGLPGIQFRTELHRVYPQRALGAHVVGFVGIENQGLAGIERSLDERLSGLESARGRLRLTLDLRVQEIVRSELVQAIERFQAEGGSGLVLDAVTGEVLSMVSLPDFDPNHYQRARPQARFNRNTQGSYELGSLFKVFTAAMALDAGVVSITDGLDATEPLQVGRHRIRDFHAHRRPLSMPEVIAFSSNIGAAKMAQALGEDMQRAYFARLGLSGRHPIRLPEVGLPQLPTPWRPINTVTASYGHGIAVTPLQVADAFAAALCGGPWRRAHLVAEGVPPMAPPALERPETSAMLRWLAWLTVAEGTGRQAAVPGYLVGGKTGSADQPGPGGYQGGGLIASFIGVVPVDTPRYVILVTLDRPQGDAATHFQAHGGWTAAPTVGRIISRIGPLLGLPPADPSDEERLRARLITGKAFNGRLKRTETSLAAAPGSWWHDQTGSTGATGVGGGGGCGCASCSTLM